MFSKSGKWAIIHGYTWGCYECKHRNKSCKLFRGGTAWADHCGSWEPEDGKYCGVCRYEYKDVFKHPYKECETCASFSNFEREEIQKS